MLTFKERYNILKAHTESDRVIKEVLAYTSHEFVKTDFTLSDYPFYDECFVDEWEQYCFEAEEHGVYQTLKKYLVSFQFPIKKNISQSKEHREARTKGKKPILGDRFQELYLKKHEELRLYMYQTFAGKLPILEVSNSEDFISIIQAILHKNEPVKIPDSMGAVYVSGMNNWNRINKLKQNWLKSNDPRLWNQHFKTHVLDQKELYQDNFIILCNMPYSNITCWEMDMSYNDWLDKSMQIRLEHECTHYFTKRFYGAARVNMHDELIADYMGITKVNGTFKSDWFLKFLGLEKYPEYRPGGRIENYLGKPKISDSAFKLLKKVVVSASKNVQAFDEHLGKPYNQYERFLRLVSLCSLSMDQIAAPDGKEVLLNGYFKTKAIS